MIPGNYVGKIFHNKLIDVWVKGEDTHIGGGVYEPGDYKFSYDIRANIQPYSSAEAKMDYGFDVVTTHTMFTSDSSLSIGINRVKYNNSFYSIKEKIEWNSYTEYLLERL